MGGAPHSVLEIGGSITSVSSDSAQTRLSFGAKMAFGVGATGEAVYLGLFNTFITIYYNQVMELNNALIGIAIMLAMIGDAISDPVVGIISDRWRSRLRRRHPFMAGACTLTLTLCASLTSRILVG